ncbi:MAG: D-alanine-D-alanine ligase [Parcubacteria group bacterium Athens0714_16]|nr:MAG: D-alanine-D-alanine ligase [Parcubacteria group bacterium Athens0714_16]
MKNFIDSGKEIKIGLLRGGPGKERGLSLNTGVSFIKNIPKEYIVKDVIISKDLSWNLRGVQTSPEKILRDVDLVINSIHGDFGEDGSLQRVLNNFSIPYTGSRALPSLMSFNKYFAKKIFENAGLKTPRYIIVKNDLEVEKIALDIFRGFGIPLIMKPVSGGSSNDIFVARDFDTLLFSLGDLLNKYETILVEEFIEGKQITCGVIDNFRNEETYELMPLEIILNKGEDFFDYSKKDLPAQAGGTTFSCPTSLPISLKKDVQKIANKAHNVLNLRHYSRSDFIVSPRRGIYLLETNALPDLSENAPFVRELNEVGVGLPSFINHLINLTLY